MLSKMLIESVQFSYSMVFSSWRPHGLQSIINCQILLKLVSIELVMLSNHLIFFHPILLPPLIFPSIRIFHKSQFGTSGGQNIGASASASVLPMDIQYWVPLGWTGLISLQSKGLSRVFFNTTVQKHQIFGTQYLSFLYSPALTLIHGYWKIHRFD